MEQEEGEPIYVSEFATEEEVAFDSKFANGCRADDGWSKKLAKVVNSGLEEAWDILDENRVLINELDHNRDSETGDDLALNIALLGELNENMHRAADLHVGLAAAVARAERKKKNAAGKRSKE